MPDPLRFEHDGADDFERSLLASARSDRMPAAARARIAIALGAAGVATAVESAPVGPSGAGAGAMLSGPKLALFGCVLALAGAGAFIAIRSMSNRSATSNHPVAITTTPLTQDSPPPAVTAASRPTVRVEDLPTAASAPKSAPRPSTTSARSDLVPIAPAAARSTVAAEAAILDGARAQLRMGDANAARARLDAYDHEFPSGALAYEAGVLRVDVLVALGHRTDAIARARRLLETHPEGPYARRLRVLVEEGPP